MYEQQFTAPLLDWYEHHGRKDLPWKHPVDAYRIWVSEIMLQQTQVQTVISYFNRFMERFPTVVELASAPEDDVLALWSGLGYYSRARNLHRSAILIAEAHQGRMPDTLDLLMALPGIGYSTAAAILSQAYNLPHAILDGNVKRVLSRFFLIDGDPSKAATLKCLQEKADACMSQTRCQDYTQAIMDLGALCCTLKQPKCASCPVQAGCQAYQSSLQLSYPQKKYKKPVPIQQQILVLMTDQSKRIYLEKRPPTGIWGGLWCFPAMDINQNPEAHIQDTYHLEARKAAPLLAFKHKFSHFHLDIQAIHIETEAVSGTLCELQGRWFSALELGTIGLAKPTQMILEKFLKQTL